MNPKITTGAQEGGRAGRQVQTTNDSSGLEVRVRVRMLMLVLAQVEGAHHMQPLPYLHCPSKCWTALQSAKGGKNRPWWPRPAGDGVRIGHLRL